MSATRTATLRVVVLGRGAIGGPVLQALRSGEVPDAVLAGVLDSEGGVREDTGASFDVADLPEIADLVIEAAGQPALASVGPRVIAAGVDLMGLSLGALTDPTVRAALTVGPGRLYLSTGAIGGLDLIRAVSDSGLLEKATIETTKLPSTLVQGWMSADEKGALLDATAKIEVMRGSPDKIAQAFPKSTNVAVAVAMAAGDWSRVEAVVSADPACTVSTHAITVASTAGSYRFEIANLPSPENPATSQLVPHAVLRAIRDIAGRTVTLI